MMAENENPFKPLKPFTRSSLLTAKTRISKENAKRKELAEKRAEWRAFHGRDDEEDEGLQPTKNLEEGKRLPPSMAAAFDENLIRTPLEEIDPFYNNVKTFVIINKQKEIFRFNSEPALGMLNPLNPVRQSTLNILTHRFFPVLMWIIIAIHFYVMLMPASPVTDFTEIFFTGIFTLELFIKVIGRGFVSGKFTYLRDPWNWLDFVLVGVAFLTVDGGNFASLRGLKALRTLRLLRFGVPGLKIILAAILKSFKNLKYVAILMLFFLFVLAVLGLQVYMGLLTQKCVLNYPERDPEDDVQEWEKKYVAHISNHTNWLPDNSYPGQYRICGNASSICPEEYTCLNGYGMNPDFDYTSFDTIGWSFLATTRLATQDYWEDLYKKILVTAGPWHTTFFILVIFLGSFYLVNLVIATVIMTFKKINENMAREDQPVRARAPSSNTGQSDPHSHTTESLRYIDDSCPNSVNTPEEKHTNGQSPSGPAPGSTTYIFGNKPGNGEGWCSRFWNVLCIWDCGFPWKNAQEAFLLVVSDPFFELFIVSAIIVNIMFLALDHYGLERNANMWETLELGNKVFTFIFALEAALKVFAMSPKYYFQIPWNRFDFFVAVVSIIELLFEDANLPGISALRSFRLLRMIRLAKHYPEALRKIFGRTAGALANLLFASLIITGTLGILGMHLYSRDYFDQIDRFPSKELPRWNFTDFWHSWMIVFRATCGEWIESMWDCMHVGDASCIPFFLIAFVVGNLVLIPLYIAIVLRGAYEVSDLYLNPLEPSKVGLAFERIGRGIKWITRSNERTQVHDTTADQPMKELKRDLKIVPEGIEDDSTKIDLESASLQSQKGSIEKLAAPGGPFRLKIFRIVQSKYFDAVVMIVLLLSCIALTFEDIDLKNSPDLQSALKSLDIIFALFFLVEVIVKLIGLGCKKYFQSGWCRFEFIIAVVIVLNVLFGVFGLGSIRAVEAMKSFRAIRFLMFFSSMMPTMNIALTSFVNSIRPILNLLPGLSIVWLFFGILGIQLFNGKFFKCIDMDGNRPDYRIIRDKVRCEIHNHSWTNSYMTFDHIGKSLLSLFQVATFKGWISIMNDAVDSRQLDEQPHREVNFVMYYFFVIFIVFGAFLTRSLFASVIIMNYLKSADESTETEYEKALETAKARKSALKVFPPPKWRPQVVVFNIVTDWKFEAVFMLFICLNILVMSVDHYQQTEVWDDVLMCLNVIFTAIFAAEAAIKIFALRCHYFVVPWNIFDFLVAVLSVFSLILSDLIAKYFVSPHLLRVIRIFRIGRTLRHLKWSKGLRTLLRVLIMALPSLVAIVVILFILMFVYSIFGMTFFLNVKLEGGLDQTLNFQTFVQSMFIMFQISTAAGWDGILNGLMYEDDCDAPDAEFDLPGNCGHPGMGKLFLVSYVVICWYFIWSMILAIIISSYSKVMEEGLTDDDFDSYYATWTRFSPDGSEYIGTDRLPVFLDALDTPLRISKPNKYRIIALDIPIWEGKVVNVSEILEALVQNFFVNRRNLVAPHADTLRPDQVEPISSTRLQNRQENNARVIQKCWRQYKRRCEPEQEQPELLAHGGDENKSIVEATSALEVDV